MATRMSSRSPSPCSRPKVVCRVYRVALINAERTSTTSFHITNINATTFLQSKFTLFKRLLASSATPTVLDVQFGETTPRNQPPSAANGYLVENHWLYRYEAVNVMGWC